MNKILMLCWQFFFILVVATGCGRGKMVPVSDKPLTLTTTTKPEEYFVVKNYIPGEPRSAFIGQSMLRVADFKATAELKTESLKRFTPSASHTLLIKHKNKLNSEVTTSIPLKTEDYPIKYSATIMGSKYYIVGVNDSNNATWGLLINDKDEIDNKFISDSDFDHYYNIVSITPSVEGVSYIKNINDRTNELTKVLPAGLNYELIYSGLNKVAINIAYREFTSENIARAAFYQSLNYEPGSKQIRFKDTVIAINEISNEQIKFTVISDGLPDSPTSDIRNKLLKDRDWVMSK